MTGASLFAWPNGVKTGDTFLTDDFCFAPGLRCIVWFPKFVSRNPRLVFTASSYKTGFYIYMFVQIMSSCLKISDLASRGIVLVIYKTRC